MRGLGSSIRIKRKDVDRRNQLCQHSSVQCQGAGPFAAHVPRYLCSSQKRIDFRSLLGPRSSDHHDSHAHSNKPLQNERDGTRDQRNINPQATNRGNVFSKSTNLKQVPGDLHQHKTVNQKRSRVQTPRALKLAVADCDKRTSQSATGATDS